MQLARATHALVDDGGLLTCTRPVVQDPGSALLAATPGIAFMSLLFVVLWHGLRVASPERVVSFFAPRQPLQVHGEQCAIKGM